MKTLGKCCLFLLFAVLFYSCNKEVNNKKEQITEPNIFGEKESDDIATEITREICFDISTIEKNKMVYYVTDDLQLRDSANLSSSIILTILPKYSVLMILEIGETETIDSITSTWIKVETQIGYIGWCFPGYVKQIEDNIIDDIAFSFTNRVPGAYYLINNSKRSDVLSLDSIISAQGYYIQQAKRHDNNGHSPEILTLSVEDGKIFIREIDLLNQQRIIRSEIELYFNGKTYVHNDTKLEIQNGKIQIIYLEHKPKRYWAEIWDYEMPYTFAGELNYHVPYNVHRLTTDYMMTFTGQYVLDSYKIIDQMNIYIDIEKLENAIIQIDYNHEKKCLFFRFDLFNFENRQIDFVETTADEPFYWSFGESAGYTERMFYFYKGGIIFSYDLFRKTPDEDERSILKFVAFFKKRISTYD